MHCEDVLEFVSKSPSNIGWSITKDMAKDLIEYYNVILKCNDGDISGEESGVFKYNNEIIRIKRTWTKRWDLYHGEWKSDLKWTGD